jgi:alkylated DNA repair dioxygenase AlkB
MSISTYFATTKPVNEWNTVYEHDGTNAKLSILQLDGSTRKLVAECVAATKKKTKFRPVVIANRSIMQTRATAFFGPLGIVGYRYSGQETEVCEMPDCLQQLCAIVNALCSKLCNSKTCFNAVLVNVYPGCDTSGIGFHADASPDPAVPLSAVAAVSFGGSRVFRLKHIKTKQTVCDWKTSCGELMCMHGTDFQKVLMHGIPPRKKVSERISFTFRYHPQKPNTGDDAATKNK